MLEHADPESPKATPSAPPLPDAADFAARAGAPSKRWVRLGFLVGLFGANAPYDGDRSIPQVTTTFLMSAFSPDALPSTPEEASSRVDFVLDVLDRLHREEKDALDRHFRLRYAGLTTSFVLQMALLALYVTMSFTMDSPWPPLAPLAVFFAGNFLVRPWAVKRVLRHEAALAFEAGSVEAPWAPRPTLH